MKCMELCHGKVLCQAELLCRPPVTSVFLEGNFSLDKDTCVTTGHPILYWAISGCFWPYTSATQRKTGLGAGRQVCNLKD